MISSKQYQKNLLEVLVDLMIKLKTKRFKKIFNKFFQNTWIKMDFKKILNN
jgi:hypothetical protein